MDIEARVRQALESTGTDYELIEIDPDLADTAAFCAHYGYPENQSANAILVASKKPPGHFAACLVLATTRLDVNSRVRRLMEVRKVSFAAADVTAELTGMMIGGVTPFALPEDLPLYIDDRIADLDWVIVGGGSRSLKLKVEPGALAGLPNAEVIEDLAKDPPATTS
jgi:prolyl-tRNA editing enzyme YbaK/EbsC (Cys-tRNA(Pro) deacylase)